MKENLEKLLSWAIGRWPHAPSFPNCLHLLSLCLLWLPPPLLLGPSSMADSRFYGELYHPWWFSSYLQPQVFSQTWFCIHCTWRFCLISNEDLILHMTETESLVILLNSHSSFPRPPTTTSAGGNSILSYSIQNLWSHDPPPIIRI